MLRFDEIVLMLRLRYALTLRLRYVTLRFLALMLPFDEGSVDA